MGYLRRLIPALCLTALVWSSPCAQAKKGRKESSEWRFQPVKSIKVRVQGNIPVWDAEHGTFVTTFGSTFEEKHRAMLDTVNMASVEGALKYVQAECINMNDPNAVQNCTRKNNIEYVVFYETTVVQPRAALAHYEKAKDHAIEHCPYAAMDGGTCSDAEGAIKPICDQYIGAKNQPKLGFCVGGELRDQDPRAPYPGTVWFSHPSSCPSQPWSSKTEACRQEQAGGQCAFGEQPDGESCTYNYRVLGYIKLDEVVGITKMQNPATKQAYTNYREFCEAGGVEFRAQVANNQLQVLESIPFWANAGDREANAARVQSMVAAYNQHVQKNPTTEDGGRMEPLPQLHSLTASNPPCYFNSKQCAKAKYGCKREWYSQLCHVCERRDRGCVVAPMHYKFPDLKPKKDDSDDASNESKDNNCSIIAV